MVAIEGLPEVAPGDDLADLIAKAIARQSDSDQTLSDTDVIVIAHKVVSKSEGRIRRLAEVHPGARAVELADDLGKDPRHVQVILDESREVLRASRGVLICVTHHGFVCANAGVDASNVPGRGRPSSFSRATPTPPRARSAHASRTCSDAAPAILITDSFGRAWRHGQVDVAIGCAGLTPLEDWRGRTDAVGRELRATWIAVADELAAAADLARTKDGGAAA